MKSEIDALLEAMFRSGVLKSKGKAGEPDPADLEKSGAPTLELQTSLDSKEAQQAMEAMQKLNLGTAENLQKHIEQLTRDAQAELGDLEQHLKEDGIEHASSGNQGNPQDLEKAFETAGQEAAERVLGQEEFLKALLIAFKRPFVAGSEAGEPLGRTAVLGKEGTGRHTALESIAASLGRLGVLKTPKLVFMDLGDYDKPGVEKLFLQDLYAALKGGASCIVFENFEKCHPSVLPLVSQLFREGRVPLPGRYAEQKGMLVDIGSALVPGAVSELSAAGKYLFLLTDKKEARIADAFGMPFLSALDDICEIGDFSEESRRAIAAGILQELQSRAQKKLDFSLTSDPSAQEALMAALDPDTGVKGMEQEAEALYQALSEAKLRRGLGKLTGTVTGEEGHLAVRYEAEGKTVTLKASEDGGDAAREEAVRAVKEELAEIVGLAGIKEYILSLEDNFKIQQLRRERGLKAESPSMHMIFTGNPGTGKTTVARIVSRYLKAIGVLTGGQLVEVTRADLVGQYVGHTAPLTAKAIQSAIGGVLFIDEAYSLYRGRDDSFGLEAIDTLVKGMEDHRDSLVVILAGYSREMEEFLTANSGLKSRFPNIVEFPDYTAEELLMITKSIVKGKGYRLDPACDKPLLDYYERKQREGDPRTNGNGRMSRNTVEEAVLGCSRRNMKLPEDQQDLELLLPEDFALDD